MRPFPGREGVVLPGAQLLRFFKDLGVQPLAGALGQKVLEKLATVIAGRSGRLCALPLPHSRRLQAVAASDVTEQQQGPPVATALARVRARAGRAVWRGGGFGAVELRPLLDAPDCRADPAADFALAPFFALAEALRLGWARPEDAQAL